MTKDRVYTIGLSGQWEETRLYGDLIRGKWIHLAVEAQCKKSLFRGLYDVSIVGYRTKREDDRVSDEFQDLLMFTWEYPTTHKLSPKEDDYDANKYDYDVQRVWYVVPATTLAGVSMYENPINRDGTAQVPVGFHKRVWKRGSHKGKDALVQRAGKIKVVRDKDGDKFHDWEGEIHEGYYGINLHTANKAGTSTMVGGWSAGCQVTNIPQKEFEKLLYRLKDIERLTKFNTYSYFLVENLG
jgi:hypothetical protein